MKKRYKKILLVILVIFLATLITSRQLAPKLKKYLHRQQIEKENIETMGSITEKDIVSREWPVIIKTPLLFDATETNRPEQIPEKAYLEVPFICQAPLETEANWVYHEESCEEAALLQAYLYETGQTMTKQQAHEEILSMIEWQRKNLGGHYDLYAEDVKEFATGYYELENSQVEVIPDASIEDIKTQIASGHPVVVPITGEILNNPYYPYPGYHMLTVIGYTEDKIITNDNGTRRGANFSYNNETFKSAMDDAGGDILMLKINKN